MPRPARFREREAAIAAGGDAPPVQSDDDAAGRLGDMQLDNGGGGQPSLKRSGEILPEAASPEVFQAVARTMGWAPKEEWKRDPSKWQDAQSFLAGRKDTIDSLKARVRAVGAVAEQAMAEDRNRVRAEAEREVREAAAARDPERAVAASEKLAKVSGPRPETVAWIARNTWWDRDPVAKAAAVAEIQRRHAAGEPVQDQLDGAEDVIRKRFPEHFTRAGQEPEPAIVSDDGRGRLSDVARREPPAVAGGQRGSGFTGARTREKGWGDIPDLDRKAMAPIVKKMVQGHKITEAEAQSRYAANYWANLGG